MLWKLVWSHFSCDQQTVSDIAHSVKGSLIPFLPMYDQQGAVSDIAHVANNSLITSCPMNNRKWVTLLILWNSLITSFPMTNRWLVTLHILQKVSHHILSHHDQQQVSDIAHFVKGVSSYDHSLWVILHILQKHHIFSYGQQFVSTLHFLWGVVLLHFSYDQQSVSDIAHFVKGSLITSFLNQQDVSDIAHFVKVNLTTSFPITNGRWWALTLHILWKAVSSHLFL